MAFIDYYKIMGVAKDIPQKIAGCIDLPAEKAQQLYALLYELLENQGYQNNR